MHAKNTLYSFFIEILKFKAFVCCFFIFSPNDSSCSQTLKNAFCAQDIKILVIFPFLSTHSRFKSINETGIIYDAMNWLA